MIGYLCSLQKLAEHLREGHYRAFGRLSQFPRRYFRRVPHKNRQQGYFGIPRNLVELESRLRLRLKAHPVPIGKMWFCLSVGVRR